MKKHSTDNSEGNTFWGKLNLDMVKVETEHFEERKLNLDKAKGWW